ncbi:TetR/AcrR family transcriptional regulator [Streptomyces sp. AK02-01A]|uniref:TetR/AcrR family transcriptional regulator n=1 Tax=Streptomyces sp. AK02-01A TaxID=3028648 RepID=UPI0029A4422A|nr:TetR family transcriptional regulator [Streptomyces sp. AK02-01A]MDX3854338.1 TetR family transcriptional regulator [Streptomyces sp. AK02-01A]
MANPSFQRARSAENKRQRASALVEAARSLALESGVASVTLTAVAERAGVHHSAVRRYFSSHKEVLLHLAEEGWTRWADAVSDELTGQAPATPREVAEALARGLDADPLFCDLLANVFLHLEHDVDAERVVSFKRGSRVAVESMAEAIGNSVPGLDARGALDIVTTAYALAATLWQVAHPPEALARAYAEDRTIAPLWALDFVPTLTRLLTAACIGISAEVAESAAGKR